jgi:UDP-glucose 4-epimerase
MVHVGGIAHDLRGQMDEAAYRAANAELPVELARRCAEAGYRRFVFVSSAKVIGEATAAPATEDVECRPLGPYATAKHDAELALARLASRAGIEIVVVRPPLVYGPGVGANFARLLRFADGPWPWPMSARGARRSLVYIDNLVDALLWVALRPAAPAAAAPGAAAAEHPVAAPGATIYHVADGPAPTIDEVVERLRRVLGRPVRRLRLPVVLVDAVLATPVLGDRARRLFGNLELDTGRLLAEGWRPPVPFDAAVERTARAWRAQMRDHRPESG